MDFDVVQRRLEAISELAAQEGWRAGLEPQQVRWVVQAAKVELVRGGSAWRAIQVAHDYAGRLAARVA